MAADLARRRATEPRPTPLTAFRQNFADRLARIAEPPTPTPEEIADRERLEGLKAAEAARQLLAYRRQGIIAQVGRRYATASLDTFQATLPLQQEVLGDVRDYVRGIDSAVHNGVGLVLMGPSGTGKDHLATAVMFEAAAAGFTVKWVNGVSLFAGARDAIRNEDSEKAWTDRYVAPDLLAISDPVPPAGMIREGWQISKLFEILDGRYREQKPTVLTINVGSREEAVKRMSENVVQRIEDRSVVLFCEWPSYRRPQP